MPPAASTATTFEPNSGVAYSDTSWPCCAKSNADASPPLPAPRIATRIGRAYTAALDSRGPIRVASARSLPGRVLGGRLVSGTVRVKPPRSGKYLDLGGGAGLPVGTQVDATQGVLDLLIPTGPRPVALPAGVRRARLSGGVFIIRKAKRSGAVTLELTGTELRRCGRRPKPARRLLADTAGPLRVKGRYAETTSRNGRWLTEDRCTSTRVKVSHGSVALRDPARGKTTTLRKGRARTVRAR